jgi:transposase
MTGVYKRRYDEEFKKNAVDMLQNSGRPLKVLAEELGISTWTLRDWRNQRLVATAAEDARHPRGEGMPTARVLAEENRRLKKDLERVTRQRDILKKAMGICSETSPGGMP